MNVIPRPLKLEESTGKINFSSSTEMTGEFDSVRAFAVNMLCDVKGEGRTQMHSRVLLQALIRTFLYA